MKKRIIMFLSAFLLFMLFAYIQPLAKRGKNVRTQEISLNATKDAHTQYDSKSFPIKGGAAFIKMKAFPETSWTDKLEDVIYENKRIVQFTVNDNQVPIKPFKIGETISQIAEKVTLRNHFSFTQGKTKYTIELDDVQMNYAPLIKFSNGTFAILHINQETSKLSSITYLSKEQLLKQDIYIISQRGL